MISDYERNRLNSLRIREPGQLRARLERRWLGNKPRNVMSTSKKTIAQWFLKQDKGIGSLCDLLCAADKVTLLHQKSLAGQAPDMRLAHDRRYSSIVIKSEMKI
jgi:hypothetical protein